MLDELQRSISPQRTPAAVGSTYSTTTASGRSTQSSNVTEHRAQHQGTARRLFDGQDSPSTSRTAVVTRSHSSEQHSPVNEVGTKIFFKMPINFNY